MVDEDANMKQAVLVQHAGISEAIEAIRSFFVEQAIPELIEVQLAKVSMACSEIRALCAPELSERDCTGCIQPVMPISDLSNGDLSMGKDAGDPDDPPKHYDGTESEVPYSEDTCDSCLGVMARRPQTSCSKCFKVYHTDCWDELFGSWWEQDEKACSGQPQCKDCIRGRGGQVPDVEEKPAA
ncbi:hypothetical protein IFR04_012337 [Cadophora malorum]|uniref:Uncharacterized protein n=1 Tax=Cadophora malorum TaxID=108018 RepID=A0A8H7W1M9_9HELO|nr:hypothetical protein IFR04_012337 [Cadophora malorum]